MVRYEALVLTVPEITADEIKTIENHFDRVMADNKAKTISFERWGKYKLSYPVKKNDYGVYFLVRFEAEQANPLVSEVKNLLDVKLHDLVMRSMISVLDPKGSLAYERPQSLEEAPAREASPFGRRERGDYGSSDMAGSMASEDEEDSDDETQE